MSLVEALDGVLERLITVPGLKVRFKGFPSAATDFPLAYFFFDSAPVGMRGQIDAFHYIIPIIVAVKWQENEWAESELAPFITSVPHAFDRLLKDEGGHVYATLGGRVNIARVTNILSGESNGFEAIGGVLCRSATFVLDVLDKKPTGVEA